MLALTALLALATATLATTNPFDPLHHLAGNAPYFEPADPPRDPAPPQGCSVTRAAYLIRHGDDHCTFIIKPPFFFGPNPTRDVELKYINEGVLPPTGPGDDGIWTLLDKENKERPKLDPYAGPIGIKALDVDPAEE